MKSLTQHIDESFELVNESKLSSASFTIVIKIKVKNVETFDDNKRFLVGRKIVMDNNTTIKILFRTDGYEIIDFGWDYDQIFGLAEVFVNDRQVSINSKQLLQSIQKYFRNSRDIEKPCYDVLEYLVRTDSLN